MARLFQSVRVWTSLAAILFTGSLCFAQRPQALWKSPSPSPAQAADVLDVICQGNGEPARAGKPLSFPGCRPCPPYTTDGRLDLSTREKFQLRSLVEGSFTAPGAHEAVAGFEGCEPHTDEYGGSILLEASGQSWSMVRYIPALITTYCRRYRLPNRPRPSTLPGKRRPPEPNIVLDRSV